MKTLAWTGVWLAAAVSSLAAQQSYVWVANGAGNSVTIKTPGGTTVTTLSAGYAFAQPYDILAVPGFDKMVVSNNTGGTLTIIDSQTLAFVASVPLTGATNLRGLSLSGDGQSVFVAAEHTGNPAVYRLQMSDLSESLAGEIVDASNFAEDCVVVNASQVGGTGNGPGKIYFSVPGGNYVGVIPVDPPGSITSISLGTGTVPSIGAPTQLERTQDHSTVYGACTTNAGTNFQILRIAVATDTASEPTVFTDSVNKTNQILDVVFPAGAPAQGYVISVDIASTAEVRAVNATTGVAVVTVPAARPTFAAAGRIRYDGNPPQLYIGETSGTSNQYGWADATVQPIGVPTMATSGTGPRAFAFSAPPAAPVIDRICPNGQVTTAASEVEIRGSGFNPASVVSFINLSLGVTVVPFVFVDSGTLLADVSGLGANLYDVSVTNLDTQSDVLSNHYLAIASPGLTPAFTVNLPSRFQGYRMLSFPQFYTGADLQTAVQAQLGGYNPSFVRIFLQNGNGYQELPGVPPGNLCDLSGRSFWALTRFGATLTLTAPAVGANTQAVAGPGADDRIVIVTPGWNMICQPQVSGANQRMNMSNILVYQDSGLLSFNGGLDVVATALATSFPIEYVNGAYVTLTAADLLQAGRGYWLRNNTAGPLYLLFQASDAVLKTLPRAAMALAPVAGLTADDLTPPPPPAAVTEEGSDTSGCGALGLEALLGLAFLLALRRRRLAG